MSADFNEPEVRPLGIAARTAQARSKKIATAIATPDDGVAPLGRTVASSFASQVAALEVGDTAMKGQQVSGDRSLDTALAKLSVMRESLRNSVAPAVRDARKRTGGTYSVSVTNFIAPDNQIYLVAIVNRIAGGSGGDI